MLINWRRPVYIACPARPFHFLSQVKWAWNPSHWTQISQNAGSIRIVLSKMGRSLHIIWSLFILLVTGFSICVSPEAGYSVYAGTPHESPVLEMLWPSHTAITVCPLLNSLKSLGWTFLLPLTHQLWAQNVHLLLLVALTKRCHGKVLIGIFQNQSKAMYQWQQ